MKLPNFTHPLYGVCEVQNTTQKVSFSFSKLRYSPFELNPENFADIWQIQWNWIRSMKFETVWIYFLSQFSVCYHPKILLPWQRDVTTSPYWLSIWPHFTDIANVFQIWSMLTCHEESARGFEPFRNREILIIEWIMLMSVKLACSPIPVHFSSLQISPCHMLDWQFLVLVTKSQSVSLGWFGLGFKNILTYLV